MHRALPTLEVRGYSIWLAILATVLVVSAPLIGVFWLTGGASGPEWIVLFFGAIMWLVTVSAGFKLRIRIDRPAGTLHVERRFWFGARRRWRIPLAELRSWYYVADSQMLVFRMRDGSRLGFILVMNGDHERAVDWGFDELWHLADVETALEESKRAKRAFMIGVPTVVLLGGVLIFLVLWQVYGLPG
ncbi:hypothetical protein GCM10029992_11600 [Glycomyces albus]